MLYRIQISGNGAEIGIGKISSAQYDFWKDKDYEQLSTSIGSNEFSDDFEIPEKAKLKEDYTDYSDVYNAAGIFPQNDELLIHPMNKGKDLFKFEGDLYDYADDIVDCNDDAIFDIREIKYPKSKFLIWQAEMSGFLIDEVVEVGKKFDPKKLRFIKTIIKPRLELITGITYDGLALSQYSDNFTMSGDVVAQLYP